MITNKHDRPRLLIVAGPNGAGKTTITNAGLSHDWFDGCEYINPDLIAQEEFGDWNDPEHILKAANLAKERREACFRNGRSLAFETVFSTHEKVDFVRRGIDAGYFVRLFFVGTDNPKINVARVAQRMMEGGHEVAIGKIFARWDRSIEKCAIVATEVHRLYLYDNSVDDEPAKLILRASEGIVKHQYEPARQWMEPIVRQLSEDADTRRDY